MRHVAITIIACGLFLLGGCDLARPWQPNGEIDTKIDVRSTILNAKADQAIGKYNQIPDGIGSIERKYLSALAFDLPRGAQFRVWQVRNEPKQIARIAFRSLGVKSRLIAERLTAEFVAQRQRGIGRWEISRSARYSPASWDYDIVFHDARPSGMIPREINRLHALLGGSPFQGRVYLDSTVVHKGMIRASLRDRRARTTRADEAEIHQMLKKEYRGFDLEFRSEDVMDGAKLKQRVYRIVIRGDWRGLPDAIPSLPALRFSPDGGPQHDPTPADTDPQRRLIDRENAKYRK